MKKTVLILLFVFLLVLSGCGGGGSHNDLPVNNIQWQDDDNGFLQFYTNDQNYYNYYFVHCYDNTENLTSYTMELKKVSGYRNMGYGIVYSYADINNFNCILIDTYGAYSVWTVSKGTWTKYQDWDNPALLKTGFNVVNTITIGDDTSTFSNLIFNGSRAWCSIPRPSGKYGFIAFIGDSSLENFPNTPEDMRFKNDTTTTTLSIASKSMNTNISSQISSGIINNPKVFQNIVSH